TQQRDDIPPAVLYLAIRAARRALAVNPEDAQAYLVLGQCYLRLLHDTRERDWAERLPDLAKLRQIQASTALNQAITVQPDLAQAYLHLGFLYREMGYLDLALAQLQTYLKLMRRAGLSAGGDAETFREHESEYLEEANRMARALKQQEDAYTVGS